MKTLFLPAVDPPDPMPELCYWFAFGADRLLVHEAEGQVEVPLVRDLASLGMRGVRRIYLGMLENHACMAAELPPDLPLPPGTALEGLRGLFGRLEDDLLAIAGRASQIITWDRTHQFCGVCGTPTEPVRGERARKCPRCGLMAYPRISPAVIVLIVRGDEVLLARSHNFPPGRYSTPAGFVEAGETLEEAVAREVREEVGIEVDAIHYFGSQSWPFPHQMMVGFTCAWAGGEIAIDPGEIADARWFTRDAMPSIPPPGSISRRLIESYLARQH